MRLLHTADWHLGRPFHGTSIRREQEQALVAIAELVEAYRVDVVLLAGDIYDRAVPPSDAIELFDDALVRLRQAGAAVVAIGGNHDSAVRVGFGDRLLASVGVTIRGDLRRCAEPVVLAADDGGPPVAIYPVPYLEPLAVGHLMGADRTRISHDRALAWALDQVRLDLAGRTARSVVVAHTFVNGAAPSDSERELSVGNVDLVGLDTLAGFDYVALGHLHRSQAWSDDRIAYAGSPVAYSFSEERHTKSVRIVDLAADGSVSVQVEPLPVGRPLRTIAGTLDSLLAAPRWHDAESAFVRAFLTDRHLPLQAMSRLQRRFPFAVELRHQPAGAADAQLPDVPVPIDTERTDPFALSVRFLDEQRGFPVEDAERAALTDAFADALRSEAS